jgi:hypothetical protein
MEFDDFVAPSQSVRAVARRDLTVASAHGKTFPGGMSAWVAQDDAAAQAPAGKALGRHPVSWGLAERDHESDLLAGEVSADVVTGGYRISGEEWLINDATLHRVVRVLAHSVRAGEESGFDKQSRDHRIVGTFDGASTADVHAVIHSFPINARRGNAEVGTTSGLSDARPELAPVLVLAQQAVCQSNRLLAQLAGHRLALPKPSIVDSGDAVLAEFACRRHEGCSFGVARPHRTAEGMVA